ncbi:TPR repeat [Prochlorococcus marinus str. NATL2A]|uniref:TPR repeat n=1 Tax=Prochlorococcus marinus (strain NATL2A) TaxID=59920 RepID=Q46IU6_PROMT|nr:TPR repeat [Prochlorococcus marinus str. NATL2A]
MNCRITELVSSKKVLTSRDKDQGKKKIKNVKTYPVPFTLEEKKKNITFNTNTPSQPSKEQIINQAIEFHSQGNIPEAAKYYKNFINQGFKDERAFSNYGVILKSLGKLKEAEISTRKAIEIKPDLADSYYNLGIILKDLGKLKESETYTRKAIELNPNYAEAHSILGLILRDLGNLQEAESYTRKAIEIKPNYAEACSNLGLILKDSGQLQEAELSCRKAIEINPNFADAYSNLGGILSDLGKLKEAELSARKAIAIKPNYAEACSNLGIILKDLGNLQEAESYTRKAIEIKPNFAEALYSLGSLLIDLDKREEAMKSLLKAVELKPALDKAVRDLAINLNYEKKFELALKYLSKNESISCQSLYLGCLLSLDREKEFNEKYQELSKKRVCNAEIGGIIEHASIIYEKKYHSPFCNQAMKYVLFEKINEESFSTNDLNKMISYIKNEKTMMRYQGTLHKGIQTSGNLFSLDLPFVRSIKKALEEKIELYRNKFKDSGQGFILNWPEKYELRSWMISMKNGGFLAPHNHEYGWVTGSFYLQIPKYSNNDNHSGDIAFSYKGPRYPNKGKNFNLMIKKIEIRDICIFPSSLFHHTIPFESTEERICFVFDLIQK